MPSQLQLPPVSSPTSRPSALFSAPLSTPTELPRAAEPGGRGRGGAPSRQHVYLPLVGREQGWGGATLSEPAYETVGSRENHPVHLPEFPVHPPGKTVSIPTARTPRQNTRHPLTN